MLFTWMVLNKVKYIEEYHNKMESKLEGKKGILDKALRIAVIMGQMVIEIY